MLLLFLFLLLQLKPSTQIRGLMHSRSDSLYRSVYLLFTKTKPFSTKRRTYTGDAARKW